ncbi:MAG: hypothetical protein ACT4UP_01625 [Gammaproteobacteria bacterium]
MRVTAAAFLMLLLVGEADSYDTQRISGTYSSLRLVEETGDLIGIEILVIPAWKALIQVAEGEAPLAVVVKLTPVGDHYEFAMPADSLLSHIRCEIRFLPNEARLSGPDCFDEQSLKRTKSYWE